VHNPSKGDKDEPEVWIKSVNWFTYVGEELAKNNLAGWEQNANTAKGVVLVTTPRG
jgi:hypothetical protein